MPMLPYPPATKPDAAEHSLLRVLGGVLAFLSLLLTLLGIILLQHVPDLILAVIVGIFALRVLILWLGDKPQQQQPIPGWSSMNPKMYPMQSPPYPLGQPASDASPKLPRSIRPQQPPKASAFRAQPAPPPQGVQPLPPSRPPSAAVPMPSPAPVPWPSQEENEQYGDGKNVTPQQR